MSGTGSETGQMTGTPDKDYNLLWYVEACLRNALRLETCQRDAERAGDRELTELFAKAQADSRKGAEMGKRLLADRLTSSGGQTRTDEFVPGGRNDAFSPGVGSAPGSFESGAASLEGEG